MTESGESLSNSKDYCSVFEKISKINITNVQYDNYKVTLMGKTSAIIYK